MIEIVLKYWAVVFIWVQIFITVGMVTAMFFTYIRIVKRKNWEVGDKGLMLCVTGFSLLMIPISITIIVFMPLLKQLLPTAVIAMWYIPMTTGIIICDIGAAVSAKAINIAHAIILSPKEAEEIYERRVSTLKEFEVKFNLP